MATKAQPRTNQPDQSLSGSESGPGYPVIPMASVIELMADRTAPVGQYAPRSPAAQAFSNLWQGSESGLTDFGVED